MTDLNPQASQMADESMVRNLDAQARAIWPQEVALIRRYELPNLAALNFVIVGLLGRGVAASARPDPQAKGLGEYLRSRLVDVPESLLGVGDLRPG